MTNNVFSENPRSFKLDRKSKLATILKSSISDKLFLFLGDHSDDVLAEYIVVLVCNGKNQHQARDNLEAFLGERSSEFVSWLWDILLNTVNQLHVPSGSSNLKDAIVGNACGDDVDSEHRICKLKDLQNDGSRNTDNVLSHGEKFHLSTSSHRRVSPVYGVCESCQHRKPEFDSSVTDINTKELCTQLHKREIPRKPGSAEVNHHESLKHDSSRVKGSSGGEQSTQYMELKKIINNNRNELIDGLQHSPKRELVSRISQSVITENLHPRLHSVTKDAGRRLSLIVADPVSKQNARPRGNVWDRLGKPCEDNKIERSKENEIRGIDVTRKIAAHNGRYSRSIVPPVDSSGGIFIPENEHRQHKQGLNTTPSPNDANNSGRKRQFGEIHPGVANVTVSLVHGNYRHVQARQTFEESERLSSVNCSCFKRLNNVSEIRKSYGEDIYHAFKSPDAQLNTKANSVSQTNLPRMASGTTPDRTLVSVNSPLVAKLGSINNEEDVNTSVKPVDSELSDVKLKLHQTERQMSEIHLKQVETANDGQINFSSSPGASSHPEEDSELRSVFVTNVHFRASKEALSAHFAKCGVIVKLIILSCPVTGVSKGSAYITFASKDSVEKALALSESPFWSRTLKVMRMTEVLPVVTPSPVLTGMPSQSWFLQQPNGNLNFQRPYSGSHLQWRRDQQVNMDRSVPNSTQAGRLESFGSPVEQKGVDSRQMHSRSLTYVRTTQKSQAAVGSLETSTAA